MADRWIRVDADLFEAAAAEGGRQQRSVRRQLEHWAWLGRELSIHAAAQARIAGSSPVGQAGQERVVTNTQLDIAIRERAGASSFGRDLLGAGLTAVMLDDTGELIEVQPVGRSGHHERI